MSFQTHSWLPKRYLCKFSLSLNLKRISTLSFPGGSEDKASACSAGDLGSIPGLGTSPGEGKGNPFQYSGLENFMNWIVHGVTKSWTQLNDFHFTSHRNDYAVDHFLCPLHRIFNTITLWVTYSYYPHFTGEDTNDQRSQITCPKLPR